MYAQLLIFDGPRSPELVAASDRAGRDRIRPALLREEGLTEQLALNLVLRRPDGGELALTVASARETFERGQQVIMSTELLPGEDPMLLPGPDRVELYEVVDAMAGSQIQALVDWEMSDVR